MRISTNLIYQTGNQQINKQQSDLLHIFQKMSTGKKNITPADDPLTSAQSLVLSQSKSMLARFSENRKIATRNLNEEENIITSIIPQVQDVKSQLVAASNNTLTDSDRSIMAEVMINMRDSILQLGNAKNPSGQFIFSGSKGDSQPFVLNGSSYMYQGDQATRNIQLNQTRVMSTSHSGTEVFSSAAPGDTHFISTSTNDNNGTGVFSSINSFNNQKSQHFNSISITFKEDKDPSYFELTTTNINTGTPFTTTVDYQFSNEGQHLKAEELGVSFKVEGKPKDGDIFEITKSTSLSHSDLNLFNTLNDVINSLKTPISGDPIAAAHANNNLNTAIQKIDINYNNLLSVRAAIGAKENEIETLNYSGTIQELHTINELSRMEDLDYYSASIELEMRKNSLEAAALAFKKIQNTSLFIMKN